MIDSPLVGIDLTEPPMIRAAGAWNATAPGGHARYRLPTAWSLHLYGYRAEMSVDDRAFSVEPGDVTLVPPDTDIRYRIQGHCPHLYVHLFAGHAEIGSSALRLRMSAGEDLDILTELFESVVRHAAQRPERARCDTWQALLILDERGRDSNSSVAAETVASAKSYIEFRLSDPLTVPEVADSCGVSPGHLTRLFRAVGEETVIGYIRRRRVERAASLMSTTTRSITSIAAEVGVPDLQAFNKLCRAVAGRSPRELAERGDGAR